MTGEKLFKVLSDPLNEKKAFPGYKKISSIVPNILKINLFNVN